MIRMRTFVAYVEDQPGVLNRIASLFRRRGYNIVSLNVGRTHQEGISRMTFVVEADDDRAKIIEANLYKMVNVLSVQDITLESALVRDMALIKVGVVAARRPEVIQLCEIFGARVLDITPDALTAEISGSPDRIEGLLRVLSPFGILEMVQTGRIAMTRGGEGAVAAQAREALVGSPTPGGLAVA
jgi:acetolactate synthase-1/3 small subunit